jgi:hypothetical protein
MDRISDMETQVIDKDAKVLLYGAGGVGKTTAATAIAQSIREKVGGRILFVDSSDGWVSLENFPSLKEGVDYLSVRDYRELPVLGDAMLGRKSGMDKYSVVILDETSSWFTDMLHAYVREATGTAPGADLPEIEGKHYQAPTAALLETISRFHRTEGLNVIIVSHERERGKSPETMKAAPSLPPQFLEGVNQRMHLVGRVTAAVTKDGYKRQVQTQPSLRVAAKSRISLLEVSELVEDVPWKLAQWMGSSRMEEDLTGPEPQIVAGNDEVTPVEIDPLDEEPVEIAD